MYGKRKLRVIFSGTTGGIVLENRLRRCKCRVLSAELPSGQSLDVEGAATGLVALVAMDIVLLCNGCRVEVVVFLRMLASVMGNVEVGGGKG